MANAIILDITLTPTDGPRCAVCGALAAPESFLAVDGYRLCDTCESAYRSGQSIEQERAEVEDLARGFTAMMSHDRPCTCGQGSGMVRVEYRNGDAGIIDMEVRHADDCPRGVAFEWEPIDEDARERVFGYRGQAYHAARLASVLRKVLHEREVMET